MNYYNEFEPYAAQWLRNLIEAGLIPAGDVDTRSIVDVKADDLAGYRQCHFFAGIGGWPLAARLAGWPDDRELWTGSAPCQPFSVAGQGKAQADDRHLWPHLFRLASARRPAVLMGEQVAAAALWPTPDAGALNVGADPVKHMQRLERLKAKHNNGNGAGLTIGMAAQVHGMAQAGSSDTTEKPGALNPAFVCWLMGFPPEWDACAPTATPSSRKSRRK